VALRILLLFVLALGGGACRRAEPVTAVVGATVFDGTSTPPVVDGVVLVQGSKVLAMGKVAVPAGAVVFPAQGRYLVPLDPASPLTVGGNADFQITGVNPALDAEYAKSSFGRMREGHWIEYPH